MRHPVDTRLLTPPPGYKRAQPTRMRCHEKGDGPDPWFKTPAECGLTVNNRPRALNQLPYPDMGAGIDNEAVDVVRQVGWIEEIPDIIHAVRETMVKAGTAIMRPGLHKATGLWAICYGLWNPVIFVDPQTPTIGGFNALIAHEAYHAANRHRLKQLVCLFVPIIGWALYPLLCPRHETLADAMALDLFDYREFMAFLHLHKKPTSWWGRWKYGRTREERFRRARECLDAQIEARNRRVTKEGREE